MSLDGKKICTLMYGQTFSCEIVPGPHTLRANNTLIWKTVTFEAEPGDDVHYTCVNRAPGSLFYLLFVFGVGPLYVTLTRGRPGPASCELIRATQTAEFIAANRFARRRCGRRVVPMIRP